MKSLTRFFLPFCLIGLAHTHGAEEGFRPLFNGKDLTGWDGNPALWTVQDGCITGTTTDPKQLPRNEFIIWRGGVVKNFELRAKIKQLGKNNTGIQYRSKELADKGKWCISGYQCDIHPEPAYTAMMYEERGRGIISKNGQNVIIDTDANKWLVAEKEPFKVDIAQWHEYTVIAQGNHLIHKIDDKQTIDLVDYDEKARALEGLIAFQIHAGPPMTVQIKDVMLKELPEGGVKAFEKANIPSDAQKIEAPKPKPKAEKPAPAPAASAAPNAEATPVSRIKVPKDFKVELLYSVPAALQGSWVALCNDEKGRIYVSDQYGDLYRFAPPAPGQPLEAAAVQKVPVNVRAINGMVFSKGVLYAGVNDYEKKSPSGLYRISDTNADDQLDKVEILREIDSSGDHGVHAVVPTPDGQGFYLITGNNAVMTENPSTSQVPKVWGDDHLLPRMPDGRGHNRHVMAPGGIIYKVTEDGKKFEVFASGFRNIYDASVNRAGELFTYDADMEYDFNTPWYRPTRVNHVVSGAENGWRNGAGKYPEFYVDNLPASLNIGPGSPTGTTFGYGAKFPAKFQNAFYVLDWSWGKIYAVHLTEKGATYTGTKEEFVTGAPLPVTDAIIHPDGNMYFAIGGRKVQSGLYRVSYTGTEDVTPVTAKPQPTPETKLRHELEAYHGKQNPEIINNVWAHLSHTDRYIRWAARTALEHQPLEQWESKALAERDPAAQMEALLAVARVGGVCPTHRKPNHVVNTALADRLHAVLLQVDWTKLTNEQRLAYVRIWQIVFNRFGSPQSAVVNAVTTKLDLVYPADNFELNWLLTETLCYLQAPTAAKKGMALIAAAESQEPQIEYARSLRMLKTGWTNELRTQQIEWFLKAANYRGGSSFVKFLEFIRTDSLNTFSPEEKSALAAVIAKQPVQKSAVENVGEMFVGRTPTMWTLDELSKAAETGMKARDYEKGRKLFSAAACYTCHRFGNAGGMTGPDLTGSGGRYSPHDLLDQIINPSKEINEQFAPIIVTKTNGEMLTGVVVNLNGSNVTLNTDPSDPDQRVSYKTSDVKSIEPSKVSLMPPGLLAMLTKEEVMDLLAYILSGGDKANPYFAK